MNLLSVQYGTSEKSRLRGIGSQVLASYSCSLAKTEISFLLASEDVLTDFPNPCHTEETSQSGDLANHVATMLSNDDSVVLHWYMTNHVSVLHYS